MKAMKEQAAKPKTLVLGDGSSCELQELYRVLRHFAAERRQLQSQQMESALK